MDIRPIKKALRAEMKAKRAAAYKNQPDAPETLAEVFLAALPLAAPLVVAGYYPLTDEMDCMPLMRALAQRGLTLCLPVIIRPDAPLVFRAWHEDDSLVSGPMGVQEPGSDKEELRPDLLLMPLLAFDRHGHRLGYGGGYYDRTLSTLWREGGCRAVGLAYAEQEVEQVPIGRYDRPLDGLATEREVILI